MPDADADADAERPCLGRRRLLGGLLGLAGLSLACTFTGLRRLFVSGAGFRAPGYGPLVPDPQGLLDLPAGFRYTAFSRTGETMNDGLVVPGMHDGMGAFPGPEGHTLLVRNHELTLSSQGAFGAQNELLAKIDPQRIYDPGDGAQTVCLGGTTTLLFDTKEQRLIRQHLSLAGTIRNCSGGPTPWGSWISCEEAPLLASAHPALQRDHGFNFEVPAAHPGLVEPLPLRAMGRFNHEAIAVHAPSGVVYQTEDRIDGLLYRFVPETPGALAEGGRLEALAIVGRPALNTSNHGSISVDAGTEFEVQWVPLDDPLSPHDDLRYQGVEKGCATFFRGEGIVSDDRELFVMCTQAGPLFRGQVWRYAPSPFEGTPREREQPGRLSLFVEPSDASLLRNGDNLSVAPHGDLVIVEDSPGDNRCHGVTPAGGLYPIARNALNAFELAGPTFSPDGSTLFLNLQTPGITVAVTGPWSTREGLSAQAEAGRVGGRRG